MYEKQPKFNTHSSYSFPSPTSFNHFRNRFNCLRNLSPISVFIRLVFKPILAMVIVMGVAVFLFWLIVHPNEVKFHVTDASLTQFNYTVDTLHYDLALEISVRNPNKRIGVYYDNFRVWALCQDARFDSEIVQPFYQGHKTTNMLNPVFKGQQVIALGVDQISELNREKSLKVYEIDVKLYLWVRYEMGTFKTTSTASWVSCHLHVPLTSRDGNSPAAGGFETTKCNWDHGWIASFYHTIPSNVHSGGCLRWCS
ncbi:NDR1/HIN1-like protein 10 [Gastrolobium bilobum]|uniref:NDR1/HIN1-like protein 10 n=1 Tax=Gastrolobium bilobum TaxID=150636 RepID=UPI002AB0DFD5|nr:NDR1/HIN1-like protein 10 [Gastrolobium bilobum]